MRHPPYRPRDTVHAFAAAGNTLFSALWNLQDLTHPRPYEYGGYPKKKDAKGR